MAAGCLAGHDLIASRSRRTHYPKAHSDYFGLLLMPAIHNILTWVAVMYHSNVSSIFRDTPARQFDIEIASSQIQGMIREEINDLYGRQKREIWELSEQVDVISESVSMLSRLAGLIAILQAAVIFGLVIALAI